MKVRDFLNCHVNGDRTTYKIYSLLKEKVLFDGDYSMLLKSIYVFRDIVTFEIKSDKEVIFNIL